MQRVLIIGATSAIAEETSRIFAKKGCALFLVGRNESRLNAMAADLKMRGAERVEAFSVDLLDFSKHREIYARAQRALGEVDLALIAHGTLGDQKLCEQDYAAALKEYETNFLSVVSLLMPIANDMENRGGAGKRKAAIAVISSVAGDRGRRSNYVYGSAKAALSAYLSGLRNRLHAAGVQVLTVKPGLVDTPMTRNFPKGHLWASPERVARGIVRALQKERDVVYVPFFWRAIMWGIRAIPERLFRRLNL